MRKLTLEESISDGVWFIIERINAISDAYAKSDTPKTMYIYYIARKNNGTYTVYPYNVQWKCSTFLGRFCQPHLLADILFVDYKF